MTLYINACVRADSRTKKLAEALLTKLSDEIMEVKLEDIDFPVTDEKFLGKRDSLIQQGRFDDDSFELARQFAGADTIVIAAPYWDLSFQLLDNQKYDKVDQPIRCLGHHLM